MARQVAKRIGGRVLRHIPILNNNPGEIASFDEETAKRLVKQKAFEIIGLSDSPEVKKASEAYNDMTVAEQLDLALELEKRFREEV